MSRMRTKPVPERTVAAELHEVWLSNKRKKDAENIVNLAKEKNAEAGYKKYPASKPTIEKALLYGHCLDSNLAELISDYFHDRKKSEVTMSTSI